MTGPVQAPVVAPQQTPQAPPNLYAIFCGNIEQATSQRLVSFLSMATTAPVRPIVHILLQSAGGYVGDGVFMYNLFRTIPLEVTLYNAGQISSAAVIAYLGAKYRKTNSRATFMIHRSSNSPLGAGSAKLQNLAKGLALDDERTEAILREHVHMPDELWTEMNYHNLNISGSEAVSYGIATEIAEFAPGHSQVFNVLA